jgi:hypothetical protein
MRAYVAVLDDRPIAIGGIYHEHGDVAFSDFKPEMRDHRKAIVEGARLFLRQFGDRTVTAYTDGPDPNAERFLKRLGFAAVSKHGEGKAFVRPGKATDTASPPIVVAPRLLEPLPRAAERRPPFIIYALPRSRTAWLSAFLTYGEWKCHHEQAVTMRSFDDVRKFFSQPNVGTVETGASPGWHLIHALVPDIKAVVIHRPVDDVIKSVRELDISQVGVYDFERLRRNLEHMARNLRRLAARPDVLSVEFDNLSTEATARAVFEHCMPYRWDRAWGQQMLNRNVQINVIEHLRYCLTHRAEIERFKRECKTVLRALYRSGKLNREASYA